ncbi:MAG TPA: NifU family protein [Erysipelotrichaceae bacterium]|nr:NifU family protein [Erysipelotrichaceae bacterium]
MAARNSILERIEHTINKIRPYIQADGGDVQLLDYQDGVVYVSMLGACAGCMAIDTTMNDGIKALVMDEVPEVKDVQMVQNSPFGYYAF